MLLQRLSGLPRWTAAIGIAALGCAGCGPATRTSGGATPAGDSALGRSEEWSAEAAPATEPGERLLLSGVVLDAKMRPIPGAKLHAYHADIHGQYERSDKQPRRLEAALRTGPQGQYEIRTIVPFGGEEGAHIHLDVAATGHTGRSFTVPIVAPAAPAAPETTASSLPTWPPRFPDLMTMGPGAAPNARRDSNGTWLVRFDIRLP